MIQAKRMEAFGTSIFTEIKKMKEEFIQRTGKEVIDFSIGSPYFVYTSGFKMPT